MKTVNEWYQKFATRIASEYDILDLIRDVRAEAFERAELEAYRADEEVSANTGLVAPTGWGIFVARRIAKIAKERAHE